MLENIPPEFILDPEYRVLPVDYGDVCINYDKRYFAERNLPVPQSLEDLLKPEYKAYSWSRTRPRPRPAWHS